jgi:vesicle-fusing ATPase
LRPGRFEYHVEVGLPTEKGRLEILKIQTEDFRKEGKLDPDINLEEIAKKTKNYSGAEIAGK